MNTTRHSRFRFSLRALLVAIMVVAMGLAIARSPERVEIVGMLWTLSWWGVFCFAIVRAIVRVGAKPQQ